MQTLLKTLRTLAKEHQETLNQILALDTEEKTLERETASLLEAGDHEDEKAVARVTALRTKLEMLPARARRLSENLKSIEAKFKETASIVHQTLAQLAYDRRKQFAGVLAAAVAPFCHVGLDPQEISEALLVNYGLAPTLAEINYFEPGSSLTDYSERASNNWAFLESWKAPAVKS
jgi:hypothetical protein